MPDPVLLITGASSGIGADTARRAAEEGYRLVLVARSEDKIRSLSEELGGPERALVVPGDVTEWEDQQRMVETALDSFGRLDAAYANAGLTADGGGLEGGDPEGWRSMVLTNIYGAALTAKAAIPQLKETRGHLLFTGSVVGRKVVAGSVYSATKFAVGAVAEAARQELVGSGVRVTIVEPGVVNTPFYSDQGGAPFEKTLGPDDIARSVVFALSQPEHVAVNEMLVRRTDEGT